MRPEHDAAVNIRALLEGEPALTTRDVVAVIHEVCAHPGPAFPSGPEDLWLTSGGELLVEPSLPAVSLGDARLAVAQLLETMLPAADHGATRAVSNPLRRLPARLRAASGDLGPQDRNDLQSILAWHVGGDARQVLRELARRIAPKDTDGMAPAVLVAPALQHEAAALPAPRPPNPAVAMAAARAVMHVPTASAVDDDLDLYAGHLHGRPAPAALEAPHDAGRRPLVAMVPAIAAAALIVASGFASYWWVRDDAAAPGRSSERRVAAAADAASELEAQLGVVVDAAAVAADLDAPVIGPGTVTQSARPLLLPTAEGAFSPAFATSGRELFFHAGRTQAGRLLVADLDERGQVARVSALLDEPARNYHPRVSPDGRLLAFDSDRGGERSVYVAERDGSNAQPVSGNGYAAVPSWSPDMKWLAFVRGEATRPRVWNLWLRNLSTGALQRHTFHRSGQVWGASWFPDGRSLCYSHEDQLVISHLDGREDIVIDTPRAGRLVRTPAVSPDGRRVVFQVFKDGVWLLDVPTRKMQRILGDRTAEEFSWAPDGSQIAFHSRRDGAWRIWMLNVPG